MDTRNGNIYRDFLDAPDEAQPYLKPMEKPPTEYQLRKMRVGRNDPCPCGSGYKFKKCCMFRIANGEGLKTHEKH